MALIEKVVVLAKNVTAAATYKAEESPQLGQKDFIGHLKISNYTSGTFTVTIEDSPDGENYSAYVSFPAASANGSTVTAPTPTRKPFASVRAVVAGAGLNADLRVELICDREGK